MYWKFQTLFKAALDEGVPQNAILCSVCSGTPWVHCSFREFTMSQISFLVSISVKSSRLRHVFPSSIRSANRAYCSSYELNKKNFGLKCISLGLSITKELKRISVVYAKPVLVLNKKILGNRICRLQPYASFSSLKELCLSSVLMRRAGRRYF